MAQPKKHLELNKVIGILFCFTLLLSCKKESLKNNKEVVGIYEWVYSYSNDGQMNSESQETMTDRYAYEFKKNGKVFMYQNGEKIEKGYVDIIGSDGFFGVQFKDNHRAVTINSSTGFLSEMDFPIGNSENLYIKK